MTTRKGHRQALREHLQTTGREKNNPEDLTASYTPRAISQQQAIEDMVRRVLAQNQMPIETDDDDLDEEEDDPEMSIYQYADEAGDSLEDDAPPAPEPEPKDPPEDASSTVEN